MSTPYDGQDVLPPEADAARVMAHPSALLAVPTDSGLGSGVAGLVVRTRAQGPTWLVDLAVGGAVMQPPEQAPWGDIFGMCADRFGISWLVNISKDAPPA